MTQPKHIPSQKATPLSGAVFNKELSSVQGGRFELGFISAFTSSLALSYTTGKSNDPLAIMGIGAAIGGTAESLGGGKFANGAVTGAFVGLFNHGMHLEETNSQVLDSSGDGLPLTGDKFYTENGQLLWDTGMEGEPNRVFVISDDKMKGYLAKMNLYASWVNAGYHQLAYSRKVGTEVNTIITDDALFIYPKSSWKDITAAIHFMGEGIAAGYLKGSYYQNEGLADHYSKLFGASGYWKNYYKAKEFSPWWL